MIRIDSGKIGKKNISDSTGVLCVTVEWGPNRRKGGGFGLAPWSISDGNFDY